MKKLLLIGAVSIILILAPNSIKTAYTISESSPKLDFSLNVEEFGNGTVLLEWQTQSEKEITGFQVECMSENGQYQPCGFVPAFGSGENHKYRYVDQPRSVGCLQYRIRKIGTTQPEYIHCAEQFHHNTEFTFLNTEISQENSAVIVNFLLDKPAELTIRVLSSTYKDIATISNNYSSGKHSIKIEDSASGLLAARSGFLEFEFDGKRVLQDIVF